MGVCASQEDHGRPLETLRGDKDIKHIIEDGYALELNVDEAKEPNTRCWVHPWVYTHNEGKLASLPNLVEVDQEDLKTQTISHLFAAACKNHPERQCMGTRKITEATAEQKGSKTFWKWKKAPFVWQNYREVGASAKKAASSLIDKLEGNTRADGSKKVAALLAETSSEWMLGAQAALSIGLTITTVYTTLGHEAMLHGLNETEAEVIFVDWEYYDILKEEVLPQCPALKHIVIIGKAFVPEKVVGAEPRPFPTEAQFEGLAWAGGPPVCTLDSLIAAGDAAKDLSDVAPTGDDLAIIMYTSGSTGLPKGVMLTHKNFMSTIASCSAQDQISMAPEDTLIGYLPLAHIFEMICEINALLSGAKIGYCSVKTLTPASTHVHAGDTDTPDLMTLCPTHMAAVPAVLDQIKKGLERKMTITGEDDAERTNKERFQGMINRKLHPETKPFFYTGIIDGRVTSVVKERFGLQNCKMLISGGAPLAEAVQKYVEAAFDVPIAQGYGATETTACTTVQEVFSRGGRPADPSASRVGAIQPNTKLKLVSVPEMGYNVTSDPPCGEILVAGNSVSQGYYKMPDKTAEDFIEHSDGLVYFHTGDVGKMHPDGVLQIIDRKKDLVKLEGGEYVSLGKVENCLKQVKGIGISVVFCQSNKKHCVCIVSEPAQGGWNSVGGKPDEDQLLKDITAKLKELKLQTFEIPKMVKVDDMAWTPDNGLVTASFKLARNPLREHYNAPGGLLEQMDYRFPDN
jgi:long-chain acyl-CoA synthetase